MTMTPTDFDTWRANYEAFTFADQQAFYSEVYRDFPEQRHWNWLSFYSTLRSIPTKGLRVVELGGWDGALAQMALSMFPDIASWTNLEICREVVEATEATDDRYHGVVLGAHVWEDPSQVPEADMAVATHTFEHLSLEHALAAVEALNPIRFLYLEIPISNFGEDWNGYYGSHILKAGWWALEGGLAERGYTPRAIPQSIPTCRLYERP